MVASTTSDAQVFAFAEANYNSLFPGTAIAGTYLQYSYRYYPGSGNYLGISTAGEIVILGPVSNNAMSVVGPVSAFAPTIAAWETSSGVGTIGVAGEVDSISYTMVAGHSYRIEVQASAGSSLNPEIVGVLDPSQAAIANASNADYGVSQNAQLTLLPATSGAYSINVQGQNSTTGGYVVMVTDLDAANAANGTQTTIAAGQTCVDSIGQSFETRNIFFSLTGGQEYQFTLQTATSGDILNAPVLRGIYDETGKQVAGSYGQASGGALTLNVTPTGTGTYYAVIADSYDDTGGFSFAFNPVTAAKTVAPFALVAPASRVDTVSADTSTNASVADNSSVTGTIDASGDQDWFGISMTAGVAYTVRLQGQGASAGTLYDPVIQGIYNSAGVLISSTYNDDSGTGGGTTGRDSLVNYTPTTSGTYYIGAGAFSSYTGTYTLSVASSAAPSTLPTLSIAATNAYLNEGNGTTPFTFTVTRTGSTTGASSAAWAVTGSGTSPADATDFVGGVLPSGTVTFAAGQTTATVTVNVAGDAWLESNDGFTVTLSNPSGAALGTSAASTTITDSASGGYGVTERYYTLAGGGGTFSLSYDMMGIPDQADIYVNGVLSATTGGQVSYTGTLAIPGTTALNAGDLVDVVITGTNTGTAWNYTVTYQPGVQTVNYMANGMILNDDTVPATLPTLSIAATSAYLNEGNSGTTPFTFTVTRTGSTAATSSVAWAVTGSGTSPANAADFVGGVLPSGTVTFAAGQTTATVTVNVAGDTAMESNDGFTVTLSNPSGATLGTSTASATITDSASGGYGVTEHYYTLAGGGGTFSLSYDMMGIPDQADIYVNGVLSATTGGQVSYTGTLAVPSTTALNAGDLVDVVITGTDTGTAWNYTVTYQPGVQTVNYMANGMIVNDDSDDYAASTSTTGSVVAGGSVTGTINSGTDADWFAVNLTAGNIYTVQLQGSAFGNGTLSDPLISGIYNSSGVYIANTYADDQHGTDSSLSFAPSASGTYYIAAEGYGSSTGTYLLSVQQTSTDVAGSTSTASTIAAGGSAGVTIDQAYDHDWYAISLTSGNSYQFTLSGTGASNYPIIYGIYNSSGSYVSGYATGVTSGSATTATSTFTPTSSGTYYVDAYSYYAGSYTLSVTQTAADIAASTATTGTVSAGGSVTGTIDSATDADWYAVSLTAGSSYTIRLQGSPSGNGTLSDALISGIYDASGVLVSNTYADDQDGRDSRLTFTPTASGTYYVAAEGYGSSTGTFLLSVSQGVSNDIAATTATTGAVSVGGSVTGTIESGTDADWYAVSLTAGSSYTIRLQGSSSGNGTLGDPLISGIYDASGILVSNTYADDQDGRDSRLTFTPTASGTYYIAAEGYGSSTGTFRLSVEQQVSADLAASVATTGTVLANSSVTGTVDTPSDQDWFAVTLDADTRYQIDLQGLPTSSGTLADPYLYGVYNSAGTLISGTADDDSGQGYNSLVTLDITTAGTYYIAAGAYGSNVGTYTLAVTSQGSTDIPADTTTTATVTAGGSVDGLVGQTGDRDWFAVALTAGQRYTIDLQPKANSTAPLLDPYLYGLYSSAGNLIAGTTDDDSGAGYGAQVAYTATASGTYYISAGGYGSNTGNYVLSVSSGTSGSSGSTVTADLAASIATTGTVSTTASASSQIETASDQDWFRVSLSAGRSYDIGLNGSASNNGTLSDPYLRGIYDSSGTLISGTTDDDSGYGNDALVSFTPTSTGTYYVSAGAFASGTGSYTLTVNENAAVNTGSTTVTPGTQGSWTVMVYVAGDNNLESFALSDINEMEAANLPQNVRVSALIDRAPGYSTADGNWTDTRFGLISGDSNMSHISSSLTSWGERNTGDPATLTEFINASALAAPADNYALVIWDHGGGIAGVAWDDSSYSANLSLNEVSQAIAGSTVTRFGMVGFDACLQGVLDQAYVLRNQADYLVASQDIEPGDGWDYTNWLSVFQQSSYSARQIATQVVNSYESFYQAQGNNQVTLSVVDTAQVSGVATAWSSFAQAVTAAGSSAMQTLHSARSSALDFQDTYVDLRSLMSNFMQGNAVASLDTSAQNVLNALGSAVLETGGLATASGLTVYLPETGQSGYLNSSAFPVVGMAGVNSFYTAYWA